MDGKYPKWWYATQQNPDANCDFLDASLYQLAMREGMLSADYKTYNSAEESIRPVLDVELSTKRVQNPNHDWADLCERLAW